MTKLLDQALDTVSRLGPTTQDEIARAMIALAGDDEELLALLTEDERAAIDRSKAAASRGELAADSDVRDVWAKRGL